jgi:hypothetical protein
MPVPGPLRSYLPSLSSFPSFPTILPQTSIFTFELTSFPTILPQTSVFTSELKPVGCEGYKRHSTLIARLSVLFPLFIYYLCALIPKLRNCEIILRKCASMLVFKLLSHAVFSASSSASDPPAFSSEPSVASEPTVLPIAPVPAASHNPYVLASSNQCASTSVPIPISSVGPGTADLPGLPAEIRCSMCPPTKRPFISYVPSILERDSSSPLCVLTPI